MMLYIVIHENLIRNLKILVTFHRNGFVNHAAHCVVAVVVVGLVSLDDFASLPVATVGAIFAYVFSDQISGLLLFKILTINAPVWFWNRSLSSVLLCTRFELFKMRMRLPITLTNVPGQYNYSCLNLFITDYWYKFGKWLTHAIIERKRSVVSNTASQQNLALTNISTFNFYMIRLIRVFMVWLWEERIFALIKCLRWRKWLQVQLKPWVGGAGQTVRDLFCLVHTKKSH